MCNQGCHNLATAIFILTNLKTKSGLSIIKVLSNWQVAGQPAQQALGSSGHKKKQEHDPACLPRTRPCSLSPTTSKRLLRRLVAGHLSHIYNYPLIIIFVMFDSFLNLEQLADFITVASFFFQAVKQVCCQLLRKAQKIKCSPLTTTKLFRNEILCSVVFNQAIHHETVKIQHIMVTSDEEISHLPLTLTLTLPFNWKWLC